MSKSKNYDLFVTDTLRDVHHWAINHPDHQNLYMFLDYDMTIVDNNRNDALIEPKVTKDFIQDMSKQGIYFAVITARFHDTVCEPHLREIMAMQENILEEMHPTLESLGIDTSNHQSAEAMNNYYEIVDDEGNCWGILYMGILFSPRKGPAIKTWLKHNNLSHMKSAFVDDYDHYIRDVINHVPGVTVFKREMPY